MKRLAARESFKITLMVVLVSGSIFLTIWFHFIQKREVLFQSIFYIPIILGCLWWDRKGIVLAAFFALLLIISSAISPAATPIWENAIRAAAFMLTAVVVAELSSRRKIMIKTLDEKVRERTSELETRNKELDAFASTVSHDLVGPIATLQGYISVARKAAEDRNESLEEESLDTLEKLGERMVNSVETLLELARAGKSGEALARIESADVAGKVLKDFEGLIAGKDIEIGIDKEMPAVMVEPVKLKQVLANLIGNAIKHAARSGPLRIDIGGYIQENMATLYVRDDGLGIEPDKHDKVFEEFERLSSGEEDPGLGLGLSIVKRAVDGWGGRVWLESSPGEGTTFLFTAPR